MATSSKSHSRSPSGSVKEPRSSAEGWKKPQRTRREISPVSAFVPPSLSLLSARRPSWTPSLYDIPSGAPPAPAPAPKSRTSSFSAARDAIDVSLNDESDEEGNFRQNLQIDMKYLVGDAVGNMSISPASRDIALGARKGLFIIDLQSPLEVPRFLPQGGTWDVADVQWNPHPARANYIVSTSSEKLLIWNLFLTGKTSIEHILRSHYRAITDINWHTTDPDIVISTGIDSWLWAWDLRTPEKPIFGLCAFNAGGTQVKWNRQDPHTVASSHMSEVLIWDKRKGSVPVSKIAAHNAKIYGIDWAHERRTELVTCSLDKTIKVWDIHRLSSEEPMTLASSPSFSTLYEQEHRPKRVIHTPYPIWRARDLPFGHGVLSLPQRGETALEMFAYDRLDSPVEVFEGHTDVVKEYVWRRGGQDGSDFQLITWSKDKTLRFWPVDSDTMQRTGAVAGVSPSLQSTYMHADKDRSFRDPPQSSALLPALSAPVGSRTILAEVRAHAPGGSRPPNPVLLPHQGSTARGLAHEDHSTHSPSKGKGTVTSQASASTSSVPISVRKNETMSRGNVGGRSVRVDSVAWLASVKRVGDRREDSGSGADSTAVSRVSSRERHSSGPDSRPGMSGGAGGVRRSSDSQPRGEDERKDTEGTQSLQDEITSVITKLAAYKIKLEKHDLSKRRTCTLGLHGPWGESSSVFIRVTFTFPRDYPSASHPGGTAAIDLERNPLISIKNRAFMLRRLRNIREQERPCLEACLRFLLFASDDEHNHGRSGRLLTMETESSSDEDEAVGRRISRDPTVPLRNQKNLAEPRTSQGVFGPNGELVCFFRAPPRIVRNALRDISVSPSIASRTTDHAPRLFQSPVLLSDAVRRLALSAHDRVVGSIEPHGAEDTGNILRIMNNLLVVSQQKQPRRTSDQSSRVMNSIPASYSLVSTRLSTVFITKPTFADKTLAAHYIVDCHNPSAFCEENARIARQYHRYDHERVFKSLGALVCVPILADNAPPAGPARWSSMAPHFLARQLILRFYEDFSKKKDLQMLAMMSVLVLQAYRPLLMQQKSPSPEIVGQIGSPPVISTSSSRSLGHDYFSLRRRKDNRTQPSSPVIRLPSSPHTPVHGLAVSSSLSSRGSWSSLFNAGSVRQFMSGVQDTFTTPAAEQSAPIASSAMPVPTGKSTSRARQSPLKKRLQEIPSSASSLNTPKSWSESQAPTSSAKITVTFASAGHARRPTFSQILTPKSAIPEKVLTVVLARDEAKNSVFLESRLISQFAAHVQAYAEMLYGWQFPLKRLELLKSLHRALGLPSYTSLSKIVDPPGPLGWEPLYIVTRCLRCGKELKSPNKRLTICPACSRSSTNPHCTLCSLPVNGLSHACLLCCHVTHLKCWKARKHKGCAAGCGCMCEGGLDLEAFSPASVEESAPHSMLSTSIFAHALPQPHAI